MSRPGLSSGWLSLGWAMAIGTAVGVRAWNALTGPLLYGYDSWAHLSYVFFLDLYRSIPYADQGWSFFHPPLHYGVGWLLAQSGSSEFLIRGLALFGSSASVGIAALAAWVTRLAFPARGGLPLLAFTAVAFLPVQLYTSSMPGNELSAACLGTGAIALFVRSSTGPDPRMRFDVCTGIAIGGALLTKFSAAIPLLAIVTTLVIEGLWSAPASVDPERNRAGSRTARRFIAIVLPALILAGPYYLRNLSEFGTPFRLSREDPLVAQVEREQPPATRELVDFVHVPARLFVDSDPAAPHMLRSIWGSVYANTWSDNFGASQILLGSPAAQAGATRPAQPSAGASQDITTLLLILGLVPTLLAIGGMALAAHAVWRRTQTPADLVLVILSIGTFAAFALFAWEVRAWSALKGSYLANAWLAYGFFVARGVSALAARGSRILGLLGPVSVGTAALVAAVAFTSGALAPARAESHLVTGARVFFGELRAVYLPAPYRRGLEQQLGNRIPARPFVANRIAVSAALDGDSETALRILEAALREVPRAELLNNRAAVRWQLGDREGALADLRRAIRLEPGLIPALLNLAVVQERTGSADAMRTRRRAQQAQTETPRGFPYGVGNGDMRQPANFRWMLRMEPGALQLWRPPGARTVP